jgi:membrane-associated protein
VTDAFDRLWSKRDEGKDVDDALVTFAGWYAAYGYWVLFLGVMLENAGVPLPGETALLAAAYLANPCSGGGLSIGTVIGVAFVAAVTGDNLGYWAGRSLARARLRRGDRFLVLTPARLKRAEGYFARYGAMTVFVARFVTFLRITAGPSAGVSGMGWWRFTAANAAGALVWAAAVGAVGYYAGAAWNVLRRDLGWTGWALLGLAALAVVGWSISARFRYRSGPETEASGGGQEL